MEVKQVKFYETEYEEPEMLYGILLDNRYLICSCCGGVWDLEYDPDEICIVEIYEDWEDFSEAIKYRG